MSRKKRTARNHRTAARPGGASPRPWRLSKRLTLLGGVVAGVLLLLGVALLMRPERRSDVATPPAPPPRAYQTSAGDAIFVGRAVCSTCHAEQDQRWHGSHHDLAMQVADEQTVLGDFENATFTYRDVTTTFFRRDGKFFVRTDGPDGQLHDYEVAYTFGVTPLQQYLIAFPGGRYQALGIAWDSRPQDAGGQHWFHLYPEQRLAPGNPLHWTGLDQTWNYQCAECHSTNLQKNYRLDGDRYETTWSELNVACEACHGPGSRHVAWAKAGGTVPTPEEPSKGLMVQLTGRDDAAWVMDPHTGSAKRTTPLPARFEVETCARCHARRGILDDRYVPGRSLMDTHRPALLEEGLYYADGQIQDEVYEYGSFLQSKMYRAGVTCSDCHDPHSLRLRDTENALCAHCHSPERSTHRPTTSTKRARPGRSAWRVICRPRPTWVWMPGGITACAGRGRICRCSSGRPTRALPVTRIARPSGLLTPLCVGTDQDHGRRTLRQPCTPAAPVNLERKDRWCGCSGMLPCRVWRGLRQCRCSAGI
jgi:Doubled CXXCH motif (Paired_CXXCH_1)/Cytochrome c554 and c-prime